MADSSGKQGLALVGKGHAILDTGVPHKQGSSAIIATVFQPSAIKSDNLAFTFVITFFWRPSAVRANT
ncbi:hypothetical protein GCM10008940_22940 [Microbulbifer agarilyticus]